MHPCVLLCAALPSVVNCAASNPGVFPSTSPSDAQCPSAPLEEPPLRLYCVCSPMLPSRHPAAAVSSDLSALPKTQHVIGPTTGPLSCSLGISLSAIRHVLKTPPSTLLNPACQVLSRPKVNGTFCAGPLWARRNANASSFWNIANLGKVDLGHRLLPPSLHRRQPHLTSRKRHTIQKIIHLCYYAKPEHVA
jgi:hypothetical protein